jgi:phosphoglycolate phosphatase
MKYDTIIFDLDGTLLNTLDDLHDSVNYALEKNALGLRSLDEIRRFVGNGVRKLIKRAVPEGTDNEMYEAVYADFERHYDKNCRNKTAPYDGVTDLLAALKERGLKLAIVSNKIDFAVQNLRKEFFADVVEVAVGDSDDTENKPAPDMVFKALRALGSDGKKAIYVGDSEVDMKTAENAGMECISVSWGFRSRSELMSYGAQIIADTPEEVFNICTM